MDATPITAGSCFHCGGRLQQCSGRFVEVDGRREPVCCPGCEAAATFVIAQGFGRFYAFREAPPAAAAEHADCDWTVFDRPAGLARYTHARSDGSRELSVELAGMHCAACVWLIENSLRRQRGVLDICVNLADKRALLRYDPSALALSGLLHALEQIGYRPRPISYLSSATDRDDERRLALKRLAVAGFGMMQVMSFAAALYAGALDGIAPPLEQLLRWVCLLVATPVVLYSARPFFVAAWRSLCAGRLGMDVPVALSIGIAYLYSLWATLRGHGAVYFDSAVMFTFLLLLGRYVEMSLQHRAALRHDSLSRLLPASILRIRGDLTERVTPDELCIGERVRVLAGERVPADGSVVSGVAEVDESLLTGESMPRTCQLGDRVTAGTVNVNGIIEVNVTRVGQESTLATVARLVDRAQAVRPPIAELAARVAAGFVGAVVLLALAAGAYWWVQDPSQMLPVVLAVLVVTCPCALSLATPAALAAATARLARAGLLVTRSRGLERLAHVDTVIFDKTGTLTRGEPRIESIEVLQPDFSESECLRIASALEAYSTHPLAQAFVGAGAGPGATGVVSTPGQGIEGYVAGMRYRIGRTAFVVAELGGPQLATAVSAQDDQSIILLADTRRVLAAFLVADTLRADAAHMVRELQGLGLTVQIASGDRETVVRKCACRLQVTEARGEMTADSKLALLRDLQAAGHRVLMVGDGINDAAVLAAADVSIAVGSGAHLAQVNADMILMSQSLSAFPAAIRTTRRMLAILRQNLAWAVIYNFAAVPLAAGGQLQPWTAALGMSLSSLLVVANSLRVLRAAAPALPSIPPQPRTAAA